MSFPNSRHQITGKLTRGYRKWSGMIQRCTNPNHDAFDFYGGAGIKVCDRWRSFDNFQADMGEPLPGYWLDREKNSIGYEPGNCRWVTSKESASNRRQRGPVAGSIKDKARQAGLPYHVVYQRMKSGLWTEEHALSTPTGERNPGYRW
jgi:hypothetical protein